MKWMIPSYIWLWKYSCFRSITLFGVELPHPLQMNIQLRKLHLFIQHFIILQLRHTTFITQSLKEIHSGRETGLIDTGPLYKFWLTNHKELSYEIWFQLAKWFLRKLCFNMLVGLQYEWPWLKGQRSTLTLET